MNIIVQHWEKFSLSLALVILTVIAVFVAIQPGNYSLGQISATMREVPLPKDPDDGKFSNLTRQFSAFSPWQEPASTHRLVVSRPIEFLPDKGLIKVYDAQATDKYGIPREWKSRYSLSLADPFVGIQDPDGDGFLNKDEFVAGTNPTDSQSHPPHITKLRIVDSRKIPFRMIFRAYNELDGVMNYQLNFQDAKDRRNRSPFVVFGDVIEEWKVGQFRRKVEVRFDPRIEGDREFDDSELDLQHTITGEKVTLILGREIDSPESIMFLRDLSAGPVSEIIEARVSRDFLLRGQKFKLISVGEKDGQSSAIVEEITTGARFELHPPLPHEEEWISRTAPQPTPQQPTETSTEIFF